MKHTRLKTWLSLGVLGISLLWGCASTDDSVSQEEGTQTEAVVSDEASESGEEGSVSAEGVVQNSSENANAFNNLQNSGDVSSQGASVDPFATSSDTGVQVSSDAAFGSNNAASSVSESSASSDAFASSSGTESLPVTTESLASAPEASPADPFAPPPSTESSETSSMASVGSDTTALSSLPASENTSSLGSFSSSDSSTTANIGDSSTTTALAPASSSETSGGMGSESSSVPVSTPSQGWLPPKGTKMLYIVMKGDTLASISAKIYGTPNYWRVLAKENGISDPALIYPGDSIFYRLDDKSMNFASQYESVSRKAVTVSAGDTLSKIAQKVYGDSGAWRILWKENPQIKNPDVLKAGMVVVYRDLQALAEVRVPLKVIVARKK